MVGFHLLVATGRRPNTDDLGADAAGVKLDARGFVEVDDHYRTSAPGVYAVGDCTGARSSRTRPGTTIASCSTSSPAGRARPEGPAHPHTAYTDPQVAGVGLTEREAKTKGVRYEVATLPFGNIARAIETDEKAGVLKILVDPSTSGSWARRSSAPRREASSTSSWR